MSIKYINNNRDKGIQIDWNKIFRAFKKLGVPDEFYDPTELPIKEVNWCTLLSNRSIKVNMWYDYLDINKDYF